MSWRCSEAAQQRGDPGYASAPPAQQWLLLEHPGPWGRHILTGSGLEAEVARALARWAGRAGSRVLLIRRPEPARRAGPRRRWCWADSRPGREQLRWGSLTDNAEVLDVLRDPPVAGECSDQPVYLVCTHGKHDVCCALRGRPVAAALAAEHPQRTWECSHVGGDRFAANLVLLPHGLYHGHVSAAAASEIVRGYDQRRLSVEWLRGRSALPAPVQAAQHFLRTATGETGVDSYPPVCCEPTGPDQWTVRLAAEPAGFVTVVVRARMQPTADPLTCTATHPGAVRLFELVSG
ncbi:MAG TPA: sucrase ferredoxin [Pseudonocardiaceae bacterium]|nr:sucrase ferredoxin [Pseudonocardiaceae bacterium]